MDAWLNRMRDNGGIIPSHVGLDGTIGGAGRKWWAGAYGWGFSPINPVTGRREDRNRIGWALPGFGNALLLTGDQKYVDAWRSDDGVGERPRARRGRREAVSDDVRGGRLVWLAQHAVGCRRGGRLVLVAETRRSSALRRHLGRCRPAAAPTRRSAPPAGSAFLRGEKPAYPEEALQWDLDLIDKRLAAMRKDTTPPDRRLADNMLDYNPVAAESLVQLMWGALMPGRNGGLVNARLRYFDPDRQRAGVPEDVAALVSELSDTQTTVTLVNLNPSSRVASSSRVAPMPSTRSRASASRHATTPIDAPHFTVQLDPGCGETLVLTMRRYANPPTARHPARHPGAEPGRLSIQRVIQIVRVVGFTHCSTHREHLSLVIEDMRDDPHDHVRRTKYSRLPWIADHLAPRIQFGLADAFEIRARHGCCLLAERLEGGDVGQLR